MGVTFSIPRDVPAFPGRHLLSFNQDMDVIKIVSHLFLKINQRKEGLSACNEIFVFQGSRNTR